MTFAEAARIMMTKSPVIKPLTITSNGDYTAPVGVDGYNPITVSVPSGGGVIIPLNVVEPGSYWAKDYGCDGFDPVNVSDIYKKLYEQLTGELPDVPDDNGNIIPDAVTNSDDDAFADYLRHISFGADGGSVTSHGLDGDTEFKFEVYVKKVIYTDGSTAYVTSVKLTTKNLVTGQEYVQTTNTYASLAGEPAHRVKITDVSVSSSAVNITFDFIHGSTGDVITSKTVQATVDSVGGTLFRGEKDWWSSVTQNSDNISCAYDTASWSTMFSLIMNTLNGKTMKVLFDNESVLDPETNTYSPSWYYEGLITIDNWKTGDKYSTIAIAYDLKPYKYSYDDPTIKSL